MSVQNHARALLESMACQNGLYHDHEANVHYNQQGGEPCPDCDGLGVVLPDEMVEAAAKGLYAKKWGPSMTDSKPGLKDYEMAHAALVAGLREIAE